MEQTERPPREGTARWYADRINAHLKRLEADPALNAKGHGGLERFFHATAYDHRSKVRIVYKSFQGDTELSRPEAARYLEYLDAGGTGRHFEALRET